MLLQLICFTKNEYKNLNYLERHLLIAIFDKGEINSEEASKVINRGKTTAIKMLNKLIDVGLVEWTGTHKSDIKGRYIIKKER